MIGCEALVEVLHTQNYNGTVTMDGGMGDGTLLHGVKWKLLPAACTHRG